MHDNRVTGVVTVTPANIKEVADRRRKAADEKRARRKAKRLAAATSRKQNR